MDDANTLRSTLGQILDLLWDYDYAQYSDPGDKLFAILR